jgi:diketogulonate reductase-like aldo/keto reductase
LCYFDCVVVHAPIEINNRFEQWKALEEMVRLGLTRSLGVANITALQLADLLKNSNISPAVFEMEVTPFNQKPDIVELCEDNSIIVINNEPLAKGIRNSSSLLNTIANDEEIPVEQVKCL